jgi:hypothetical protein
LYSISDTIRKKQKKKKNHQEERQPQKYTKILISSVEFHFDTSQIKRRYFDGFHLAQYNIDFVLRVTRRSHGRARKCPSQVSVRVNRNKSGGEEPAGLYSKPEVIKSNHSARKGHIPDLGRPFRSQELRISRAAAQMLRLLAAAI